MTDLTHQYEAILKKLRRFCCTEDNYSGVFLPVPADKYWASKNRIMLVGRETAGWNTDNNKNTLNRIFEANETGETKRIVDEAIFRYKKDLFGSAMGPTKRTSRSRFKQFHFRLANELSLPPEAIVHCNLFAWDYDKKSPLNRPPSEREVITSISRELLATQIKALEPNFIIFATGYAGITQVIKDVFNEYFGGYKDVDSLPRKLWAFEAANSRCFRIAHPRAQNDHEQYRKQLIERIRRRISDAENA